MASVRLEPELRCIIAVRRTHMSTFLSRFVGGDCQRVWNELLDLGDSIREEPLYSDALGVARETMRRARHNIEALIPRLEHVGYQFGYTGLAVDPEFAARQPRVFKGPKRNIHQTLARLEALVGSLPLSLYAWYEQIGEVNFVGKEPASWKPSGFKAEVYGRFVGPLPEGIPANANTFNYERPALLYGAGVWLDPLQAISPHDQFDLYKDWKQEHDYYASLPEKERDDAGQSFEQFALEIAPDADFKFDTGGLDAYEIAVPNRGVDGILLNEWHHTTFVDYLRTCFQWAGFPGLEMYQNPPKELPDLTSGLLPF
jgi:hypothetical protein